MKLINEENPAYNFYYMSDDSLFYMETEEITVNDKTIEHSQVYMIECLFGGYKKVRVFED